MDVFKVKGTTLETVPKNAFKLEKDIQTLVEANLDVLFDLEFVSTEFRVGEFRLDTLAFDNSNSSFVIVEYKKGSSYSVVDQGYSYLSAMLNNKAEFILEYNERTDGSLKRNEVDWSSSKVVFVSPSFNSYQRNSVNFRDVPFELWEIKRFDQDLVSIEKIESVSNESIEGLGAPSSANVISTVSAEIQVKTEADHVSVLKPEILPVWQRLKEVMEEYPETSFQSKQPYISWLRKGKRICYIRFQKNALRISILRGQENISGGKSSNFFTLDDPKKLADEKDRTVRSKFRQHSYVMHLRNLEEIDYLIFLLDQKYKSLD